MNASISAGAPVKTMAEVLEEHPSLYGAYEWTCSGCMADIGNVWSGIGPELLAAHQAERLAAAGFGDVGGQQARIGRAATNARDALALELFIGENGYQPRESSVKDWIWLKVSGKQQGQVERYKAMAEHVLAVGYQKAAK